MLRKWPPSPLPQIRKSLRSEGVGEGDVGALHEGFAGIEVGEGGAFVGEVAVLAVDVEV